MKKTITLILCAVLALCCAAPAIATAPVSLQAVSGHAIANAPARLQAASGTDVVTADGMRHFADVVRNAGPAPKFSDVSPDKWYGANQENAVGKAASMGLMIGDAGSFMPEENVTVAQAVAMAARLNSIYYNGTAEFTEGEPWYQVYADYCAEQGIITAARYPDMTAKATRAQYGQLIYDALPAGAFAAINTVESGAIPDVPQEGSGGDYAYRLYRAGIVEGKDGGKFCPGEYITRAESAALIARVVDVDARRYFTLTLTPQPSKQPVEDTTLVDTVLLSRQALDAAQKAYDAAGEAFIIYADASTAPELKPQYLALCMSKLESAYEMAQTCAMHCQTASPLAEGDVKSDVDGAFNHAMAAVENIRAMYQSVSAATHLWPEATDKLAAGYMLNAATYLARAYETLTA